MNTTYQKLHSKRGASMLLALLFLFFCLTLGAIVLTAASVNAGRTTRLWQEQQDYLAVQSATRLLRDDLQNLTFTGIYTQTVTETTNLVPGKPGSSSSTAYRMTQRTLSGATLAPTLEQDFFTLYATSVPQNGGSFQGLPHSLSLTSDTAQLPSVRAELSLAPDYSLTAIVQQDAKNTNLMSLSFTASVQDTNLGTETTTIETPDVRIVTHVTTYKTVVELMPGMITKGVTA